jgi:CheY-like chemotaxis protein
MGKSSLVVDDDELIRSFLSTILREEGHRVEEARNGKEGSPDWQKENSPVITDLRMPGISGLGYARKKEKPEPRWISSRSGHRQCRRAMNGGINYLTNL